LDFSDFSSFKGWGILPIYFSKRFTIIFSWIINWIDQAKIFGFIVVNINSLPVIKNNY
jgi:hypothetical protein